MLWGEREHPSEHGGRRIIIARTRPTRPLKPYPLRIKRRIAKSTHAEITQRRVQRTEHHLQHRVDGLCFGFRPLWLSGDRDRRGLPAGHKLQISVHTPLRHPDGRGRDRRGQFKVHLHPPRARLRHHSADQAARRRLKARIGQHPHARHIEPNARRCDSDISTARRAGELDHHRTAIALTGIPNVAHLPERLRAQGQARHPQTCEFPKHAVALPQTR